MSIRLRFPSMKGVVAFNWRFEVMGRRAGWRGVLAHWLTWLATRTDGQTRLVISISSTPALSVRTQVECMRHGLGAMQWAVEDAVKAAAFEELMRQQRPELYETSAESRA